MERTSRICSTLCLLASLTYVVATPIAAQVVIKGPPSPVEMYESLCVLQGGLCRYVSECPTGQLTSIRGLCPTQQSQGVECCYTGRRVRSESSNVCEGENFCMPQGECGRLAPQQGGCADGSVCCTELDSRLCRHRGGACFAGNVPCGIVFNGPFEDCGEQDTCCLLD